MLRIACPSSRATDRHLIFVDEAHDSLCGIVLVTTSVSIGDFSIRSIAGPDNTPCTAQAMIRSAPLAWSACAAYTIVPAESMMSSCSTQVRPRTSPITFITSAAPVSELRRLSMIASSAPTRLA
jgi:hypothetical protein